MLDTHVAVAAFEGRGGRWSAQAARLFDSGSVLLSPAVVLELELLHEIGRIRHGGRTIARYLAEHLDIAVAGERFSEVVDHALDFGFTRDPFDRLILAHAAMLKARLLTHDGLMHANYALAVE
ncbi:MAG: PIN domain-containing protein [Rudaea sp.]|uniref:type II toxin-antitoxin system VapC family toxin n=1 Tax=Rudaea sp. TaxID=2136325 RepID=UPI0039E5E238